MKLLLLYTPFCAPTVPPYSISYLKAFLDANSDVESACLDLNAKFHRIRFSKHYDAIKKANNFGISEYGALLDAFDRESRPVYSMNNKSIVEGRKPELIDELFAMIASEKPDAVAFSLVYNSQAFYAKELIIRLKEKGIPCIIGGPASNSVLEKISTHLKDGKELLNHLERDFGVKRKLNPCNQIVIDFSIYPEKDYLSKDRILPLRSCRGCYYKQCAFCTHHHEEKYSELDINGIRETIIRNGAKKVFFIDDMISKPRLFEIAKALSPLGVIWWCQLRPAKELLGSFGELKLGGLRCISWGVESASQRILDKMRKGTLVETAERIINESHDAGILNVAYVMFGFPGEEKEDFMKTLEFLKKNSKAITLVSTTIFGLQKGSRVFDHPEEYGVADVEEVSRTVLDEKIRYRTTYGMQNDEAKQMRKRYILTIKKLNKLPKVFNYYKEQTLAA